MKMSIEEFKGKFEENFQKWRGKDRYRILEWRDKVVAAAKIIRDSENFSSVNCSWMLGVLECIGKRFRQLV